MSLPILQTKLYAPRRRQGENVVHRPRLTEKLQAGLGGRVTLISAPAGFGKSTLLGEWIAEAAASRKRVTWLALDNDDNDPVRFLTYLIAGLQKLASTVGETVWDLLPSPQLQASKTILTILINDLSLLADEESVQRFPFVLVLEDYHMIAAQPVHEALTYLIDHLPPHVHVIVTTRADPPLPLARWRAGEQLSEIRADDLRFTPDETAAFLNDRMKLHLSTDEVKALETRTEGWIAGLQLVALSMHGRDDKAGFLQSFPGGHRYILSYLVEEVLNQQPKAIQDFLLRTSILDRLCGPLCDTILDDLQIELPFRLPSGSAPSSHLSQSILEQIEHANLFLVSLDDEDRWYRYHRLFVEMLQHRLRQNEPDLIPDLHRRASRWYEDNGLLADAIHHALLAADFARTAELIERIWQATWNRGIVATLLNWVRALPREALAARPSLAVSYAWALALTGQIGEAEDCLRQVEAPLLQGATQGHAAALRAMMATRHGETERAVQLAQNSLTLIPVDAALQRGGACLALGMAYQQSGTLTEAVHTYQEAARLGAAAGDVFLTIAAPYHEARAWMAQGRLHLAAATYQRVLEVSALHKRQLTVAGLAHMGYAEILYQWNDLTTAALHVETGLQLDPPSSLTYIDDPLHRFSILARIRQAMGDREGALSVVRSAKDSARQTGIALDGERAAALEALIYLRLGQAETANRWAQRYTRTLADEARFEYLHEFETMVFVRVLLAQTRPAEILSLFARWLPAAEAVQRQGSIIEMCLLQALALGLGGHSAAASHTLARALALAKPEGYVRLFLDEGAAMAGLLSTVSGNARPYAQQLLEIYRADRQAGKTRATSLPVVKVALPLGIESLSDRELDVLRLIAAGLSNAAIAEQLLVSVGTVKSHLKHIYGKLAVQSRTQAVARARSAGLL